MKKYRRETMAIIFFLLVWPAFLCAEKTGAPEAFVAEPVYTFSPVIDGVKVNHDFLILNKGSETLLIEKVKPTCGCTTTSYTKEIKPGGSGVVKTLLRTSGQGGRHLKKTVKVYTNDPKNELIALTLTGPVNNFAEVSPKYITFRSGGFKNNEQTITIRPLDGYPFKIKSVEVDRKKELGVELREIKDENERTVYEIIARNLRARGGRIRNRIVVITDSPVKDKIIIRVGGFVNEVKKTDIEKKRG